MDGNQVGQGRVQATQAIIFSDDETTDVGRDTGSPVTSDYGTDNAFSGQINWVQLDLDVDDHDHLISPKNASASPWPDSKSCSATHGVRSARAWSSGTASTGGGGVHQAMADDSLPLTVQESPGRVRLWVGSLAHGDGATLQDAADDLVQRLLSYAMAFRSSGMWPSLELGPPDLAAIDFLYQLGEIAAAGGDIRGRLFG